MFIVLIIFVICLNMFDLGNKDQPKKYESFYIFLCWKLLIYKRRISIFGHISLMQKEEWTDMAHILDLTIATKLSV